MICTTETEPCKEECIVGCILYTWMKAGFPVIQVNRFRSNVKAYIEKYCVLKKSMYKVQHTYVKGRVNFVATLGGKNNHTLLYLTI